MGYHQKTFSNHSEPRLGPEDASGKQWFYIFSHVWPKIGSENGVASAKWPKHGKF